VKHHLEAAIEALYAPVMEWIHSPSIGKAAIMRAWHNLSAAERAALDADVLRVTGPDVFVAWRYKGLPTGKLGGSSLTTKEPKYLTPDNHGTLGGIQTSREGLRQAKPGYVHAKYRSFLIHPSDVMVHWKQEELPLSSRAFGHEQEIILKPDVE
jgi:hypothetical protein